MGRGAFTQSEIEILRNNPYVLNVNEKHIYYSTGFKVMFMEEYLKGKGPTQIFKEAGFDCKILGSKRIERACARWKESYQSGTLGAYNAVFQESDFEKNNLKEQIEGNAPAKKYTAQRCHEQEEMIRKLHAENELLRKICQEQGKQDQALDQDEICRIIEEITQKDVYHGCIAHLCKSVGISHSTFYRHRREIEQSY